MKLLIIADNFGEEASGGAEESLTSIIKVLGKHYELDFLKQIKKRPFFLINFDYVINLFRIYRKAKKYKPDIIITQRRMSFPSIIYGLIKKIPVINFVHDVSELCPKWTDIVEYGRSCFNFLCKKECFNCIKNWKKLRITIGNRSQGWDKSLKGFISTYFYMFRYFLCKINKRILLKNKYNIVPSELLKNKLQSLGIRSTTVNLNFIDNVYKEKPNIYLKKLFENAIIFIVPSYDDSHKGTDFIFKLADKFPEKSFVIIGKDTFISHNCSSISQFGRLSKKDLSLIYKAACLTIVPSFSTEGFNRVVLESLINGTRVICSSNCGIGEDHFFKNKSYLSILPIDVDLWSDKLQNFSSVIEKKISDEEIKQIQDYFSKERFEKEIQFLLDMLYYEVN